MGQSSRALLPRRAPGIGVAVLLDIVCWYVAVGHLLAVTLLHRIPAWACHANGPPLYNVSVRTAPKDSTDSPMMHALDWNSQLIRIGGSSAC